MFTLETLVDLAPAIIIIGGLVCLGFYVLYCYYRGGIYRCIRCGTYTWGGIRTLDDAGNPGNVHPGGCPTSAANKDPQ